MGWDIALARALGGFTEGYTRGQELKGAAARRKLVEQESEERKRRLDEEKGEREKDAKVERRMQELHRDRSPPTSFPPAQTGTQQANIPTADTQPANVPATTGLTAPAQMAAAGGADIQPAPMGAAPPDQAGPLPQALLRPAQQSLPLAEVRGNRDPLADYKERIRIAEEIGHTQGAARWRAKLTEALSQEAKQQALLHEQQYAPIIRDIEMQKAEAERLGLPFKLNADQQAAVDAQRENDAKRFAASILDISSPDPRARQHATETLARGLGIEGVHEFRVAVINGERYYVPVDVNGQGFPDPSKKGKEPLKFHIDDATEHAAKRFGVDKKFIRLGEGDTLFEAGGGGVREVARGQPKKERESRAETDNIFNQRIGRASNFIDQQFGFSSATGLIVNDTPENRASLASAKVKAEQYIRGGMDPMAAANKAVQEARRQPAAGRQPAELPPDVRELLR